MGLQRRQFSRDFKLQVLSALESGKSRAQISREFQIAASLIDRWRSDFKAMGDNAFPGNGITVKAEAKVAELERIIGQLTLENTVLKKVLRRLRARTEESVSSRSEK